MKIEEKFEFENDGLYRCVLVYGHVNLVHRDLVMNKDVFIACYKKWILEAEDSRKGHWIIKDRYYHDTITAECSECGREVEIPTCMSELMYNGCPYCLADMRGDIDADSNLC